MGPGDNGVRILHDLQRKCNELNRKIDSLIRMMEMMATYMRYSGMMAEMAATQTAASSTAVSQEEQPGENDGSAPEGDVGMNQQDFQRIMNMAKNSDHAMSEGEFQEIFESLKKGKSEEEVARMEQMVRLARSFMK